MASDFMIINKTQENHGPQAIVSKHNVNNGVILRRRKVFYLMFSEKHYFYPHIGSGSARAMLEPCFSQRMISVSIHAKKSFPY
jgi:hypothetical protein